MAYDYKHYLDRYKKEKYDRIVLYVPKEAKADLKSYADANNISLTELFLRAIEHQYHFDFDEYRRKQNEDEKSDKA